MRGSYRMAPVSTLRHIFSVAQRDHQLVEELAGMVIASAQASKIAKLDAAHLGVMLRMKALLQHSFRPCIPRKTWCNNMERRVIISSCRQERQHLRHFEEASRP